MKKLLISLLVSFPLATMAQRLISSNSTVEPDKTFGNGGTKTITIKQYMVKNVTGNDSSVVESRLVSYKDSKGRTWEEHDTIINTTTMTKNIIEDQFDEKGRLIHTKTTFLDAAGQLIEFYERRYKDGEKTYDYREYGTGEKEIFDPKTGKTTKIPAPNSEPKKDEPPAERPKYDLIPDLSPSTYTDIDYATPTDKISLAPGILHFGDNSGHYNSFGITGSYTHYLNPHFGVSLNAGFFNHKTSGGNATESYKQVLNLYNYTAGVDLIPGQGQINHLGFAAHAYAGYSNYAIKEKTNGYGSYSNSYHSFIADAGVEEFYETLYWHFAIQLAYTPTFLFNTTQNNVRLAFIFSYLLRSNAKKNRIVE